MKRLKAFGRAHSVERLPAGQAGRGLARLFLFLFYLLSAILHPLNAFTQDIKGPNVAGQFYPQNRNALSSLIDNLIAKVSLPEIKGDIFCLISPHAGYAFSGGTAAFGYKAIKDKPYTTVIILAPSHYYAFNKISVYKEGKFRTPLGDIEIDSSFTQKITNPSQSIEFIPQAFAKEHSLEVQLPFLQRALTGFKIVPIVIGDCAFEALDNLANNIVKAIGARRDVLVVASTDLMHSYDYKETEAVDRLTLSHLEALSAQDIYDCLRAGTIQMCGGLPIVTAVIAAQRLGYTHYSLLHYTNSAIVTGNREKGVWTVGYASAIISGQETSTEVRKEEKSEESMLTIPQEKRLLEIARKAIEEYISSGRRLHFVEDDPRLKEINGAFVTLHAHGELRGCIGNIVGQKPLFETVRDMAIESATGDPRFAPVAKDELKDIEIEVSVLSPLKKIRAIDEFILGTHGVLVRQGWNQGVFLPQVAIETGWSKEEFLSNLCLHKAGLPSDAWKENNTEIFVFSALVFSEKQVQ